MSALQENAAVLLGRQQKEQEWFDRLMPYWTSLPTGNGSIFCRHLFAEHEVALLQSDSMVRHLHAAAVIIVLQIFYGKRVCERRVCKA